MAADPGAGWGREPRTGTLVAWSCTTGWLDWIHGELWLLPDGLLRIRLSLGDTQAHGLETLPPDEVPTRTIGDDEIEAAIRAHKTNHWIPADAIRTASFRRGLTTTRLALGLADGSRRKLLWLRNEPASTRVPQALRSWGIA